MTGTYHAGVQRPEPGGDGPGQYRRVPHLCRADHGRVGRHLQHEQIERADERAEDELRQRQPLHPQPGRAQQRLGGLVTHDGRGVPQRHQEPRHRRIGARRGRGLGGGRAQGSPAEGGGGGEVAKGGGGEGSGPTLE